MTCAPRAFGVSAVVVALAAGLSLVGAAAAPASPHLAADVPDLASTVLPNGTSASNASLEIDQGSGGTLHWSVPLSSGGRRVYTLAPGASQPDLVFTVPPLICRQGAYTRSNSAAYLAGDVAVTPEACDEGGQGAETWRVSDLADGTSYEIEVAADEGVVGASDTGGALVRTVSADPTPLLLRTSDGDAQLAAATGPYVLPQLEDGVLTYEDDAGEVVGETVDGGAVGAPVDLGQGGTVGRVSRTPTSVAVADNAAGQTCWWSLDLSDRTCFATSAVVAVGTGHWEAEDSDHLTLTDVTTGTTQTVDDQVLSYAMAGDGSLLAQVVPSAGTSDLVHIATDGTRTTVVSGLDNGPATPEQVAFAAGRVVVEDDSHPNSDGTQDGVSWNGTSFVPSGQTAVAGVPEDTPVAVSGPYTATVRSVSGSTTVTVRRNGAVVYTAPASSAVGAELSGDTLRYPGYQGSSTAVVVVDLVTGARRADDPGGPEIGGGGIASSGSPLSWRLLAPADAPALGRGITSGCTNIVGAVWGPWVEYVCGGSVHVVNAETGADRPVSEGLLANGYLLTRDVDGSGVAYDDILRLTDGATIGRIGPVGSAFPGYQDVSVDADSGLAVAWIDADDRRVHVTALPGFRGWTTGDRYVPLTPRRVADTRSGTGLARRPLAGGSLTPLTLPTSVPPGSTALVDVSVVGPSASGYLRVAPTGTPATTTAMNFSGGVSQTTLVQSATDGQRRVGIYVSATTEVVVDLVGYETAAAGVGGAYVPITPTRAYDSRGGDRALLGTRTVALPAGAVPPDVGTVLLDVSLVAPDGPVYTRVSAHGVTPTTTVANTVRGRSTSQLVATPTADGSIDVTVAGAGASEVVVDVVGYISPFDQGSGYLPMHPTRLADTRVSTGTTTPSTLTVSVPAAQHGDSVVWLDISIVAPTSAGFLRAAAAGTSATTTAANFAAHASTTNLVPVRPDSAGRVTITVRGGPGALVVDDVGSQSG